METTLDIQQLSSFMKTWARICNPILATFGAGCDYSEGSDDVNGNWAKVETAERDCLALTSLQVFEDGTWVAEGGKTGLGDYLNPGCRSGAEGTDMTFEQLVQTLMEFINDWTEGEEHHLKYYWKHPDSIPQMVQDVVAMCAHIKGPVESFGEALIFGLPDLAQGELWTAAQTREFLITQIDEAISKQTFSRD